MADAMQGGIMALPPEMGGMGQPPQSFLTPEDETTLNQLRQSISKKDFSDEMLNAAEQVDPESVMQLRAMLRGMQLPPELIDLLQQMIDMVLSDPGKYQENRAKFLAEGVPEELLPPEFDPQFFAALSMALDQVSRPMAQGFAGGGMAMNPIAGGLASLGRYGDSMLAHITPQEAVMLRRAGGSGSINPATGLPEFFNLFKAVGSAFKAVGNAVKDVVKGVGSAIRSFAKSTVGRIVTSVALGFLLGPAAAGLLGVSSAAGVAAISGFVGGAGSTLLAGGSFRDALKTGAIGGLTAGAVSGISGGAGAFQSGSYTGPTTVSGQWRNFAQSLSDKTGIGLPGGDVRPQVDLRAALPADQGMITPEAAAMPPASPMTAEAAATQPGTMQAWQNPIDVAQRMPVNVETAAVPSPTFQAAAPATEGTMLGLRVPGQAPTGILPNASAPGVGNVPPPPAAPSEGVMDLIKRGRYSDAAGKAYDYFSPGVREQAGAQQAQTKALEAVNALPAGTAESVKAAVFNKVYESNLPGMLATYGPLAAAGLGATYLMGGFTPQPAPKPKLPPSGAELYAKNPYLITPQIYTISASTGQPYQYATGGIASLAQGTQHFPRKNGPIDGPGTGTSDSIPAMLSDGEFVFTAKAVRAMGKGSRRKGAKRMYALMKALEKRA